MALHCSLTETSFNVRHRKFTSSDQGLNDIFINRDSDRKVQSIICLADARTEMPVRRGALRVVVAVVLEREAEAAPERTIVCVVLGLSPEVIESIALVVVRC